MNSTGASCFSFRMLVDLSVDGKLGIHALKELSDSVHAAQRVAMASGKIGMEKFASSKTAESILRNIARVNPALVSREIMRYYEPNDGQGFSALGNLAFHASHAKAPPLISVQPMKFPIVEQGFTFSQCLIHRKFASQNFL